MDSAGINTDDWQLLLGSLYDSVTAESGFQTFNDILCRHFDLRGATLIVRNAETLAGKFLWQHGSDPVWLERYAIEYGSEDLLAQHVVTAPIAQFYASNLDIPFQERIAESRFYREWIVPQNIAYAAGSIVMREGEWLTEFFVQRSSAQPPFTRHDLARLNQLIPHLQRAIQMRQRFMDLQIGQTYLAGVLDRLVMAAILFDHSGRIAFANASATAQLKKREHWWRDGGKLSFRHSGLTHVVDATVHHAIRISGGEEMELDGVVMVPRTGQSPLTLMITPLRVEHDMHAEGAALLFAFDPQSAPLVTPGVVRHMFGLTEAEAELAVALCCGKSLDEAALERGVSVHTTRAQLKNVFIKTGTKRQADLMSLLLTSPAYFLCGQAES